MKEKKSTYIFPNWIEAEDLVLLHTMLMTMRATGHAAIKGPNILGRVTQVKVGSTNHPEYIAHLAQIAGFTRCITMGNGKKLNGC
jgi:hypothetical protein